MVSDRINEHYPANRQFALFNIPLNARKIAGYPLKLFLNNTTGIPDPTISSAPFIYEIGPNSTPIPFKAYSRQELIEQLKTTQVGVKENFIEGVTLKCVPEINYLTAEGRVCQEKGLHNAFVLFYALYQFSFNILSHFKYNFEEQKKNLSLFLYPQNSKH
jgi:hypothetical protein